MRFNKLAVGVAGVALGALVVTGVQAIAQIPAADGSITACVTPAGATRIIDTEAGQTCLASEKKVSWRSGWRNRGAFDAAQTYEVGDVVHAQPGDCPYNFSRSYQRLPMRVHFVKTQTGGGWACDHSSTQYWAQLSYAPLLKDVPGAAGYRVPANASDTLLRSRHARTVRAWNYGDVIWLNVQDTPDATQCAVTATPVTSASGVTVTRGDVAYKDWILLYTKQGAGSARFAVDVMLDCPVK